MEDHEDFRDSATNMVTCFELGSDQPGEAIGVHRVTALEGVEFWSVTDSARTWEMLHDKYSAWLVGKAGAPSGRWQSRGAEYALRAGTLQLVEPGEVHRATELVGQTSFFVIWWEPAVLERLASDLGIQGILHFSLPQIDVSALSARFEHLSELVTSGQDALAIEETYLGATQDLIRVAGEGAPARRTRGRHHPAVRQAIDFMSDRLAETISLDTLAAEAKLSKFHFARCFQAATGVAPHKYLTLIRVREARRLLECGLTVGEAADRTGFADASHLSRTFRRWIGVAPGAWGKAWIAGAPTAVGRKTTPPPSLTAELEQLHTG